MEYPDWLGQPGVRCRMDWGPEGARAAAAHGDALVVVDTLRFSSAVATALHHDVRVHPCAADEDVFAAAANFGAEPAGSGIPEGRYSLSPLSYVEAPPGARVCLRSPNGATCTQYASSAPFLYVAALLNAAVVGRCVSRRMELTDLCVTVLACGELQPATDGAGGIRFAIEDYLGAGAVLASIPYSKSPEAELCEASFQASKSRMEALLAGSSSGLELSAKGRDADVRHCAALNVFTVAPMLLDGWFVDDAGLSPSERASGL